MCDCTMAKALVVGKNHIESSRWSKSTMDSSEFSPAVLVCCLASGSVDVPFVQGRLSTLTIPELKSLAQLFKLVVSSTDKKKDNHISNSCSPVTFLFKTFQMILSNVCLIWGSLGSLKGQCWRTVRILLHSVGIKRNQNCSYGCKIGYCVELQTPTMFETISDQLWRR